MEAWGVPIPLAILAGLGLGLLTGLINGVLTVGTGINGFIITLATLSAYKGINLGITEAQPFSAIPDAVKAFGQRQPRPGPPPPAGAGRGRRRGLDRDEPKPDRPLHAGGRRQPACGRALRHLAEAHHRGRPHALRPARRDRRHAGGRAAAERAADHRRRLADHLLRRARSWAARCWAAATSRWSERCSASR